MEVNRTSLYGIDYYKKNTFTGSLGIMNYRIYKVEENNKEEQEGQESKVCLEAVCWRGPYIFAKTEESQKVYKHFSFDNKGLDEITTWLDKEYEKMNAKDTF